MISTLRTGKVSSVAMAAIRRNGREEAKTTIIGNNGREREMQNRRQMRGAVPGVLPNKRYV